MKTPTSPNCKFIVASLCLLFLLLAGNAQATTYYLDVNGATTNSGVANGSTYTWENSIWSTSAVGNIATTGFVDGGFPEFSTGTDGGTASYTVNAGSAHTVVGMVERNSSGTVTLTGATLTIGAGAQGFLVGPGSLVINNVLTGSGGMVPECNVGCGNITLNGNNTFTGGFYLGGAQYIYLGNANGLGTGPIYLDGITFGAYGNDGILVFKGSYTIPNAVNFGSGLFSTPSTAIQDQFVFVDSNVYHMTFTSDWVATNTTAPYLQFGNFGTNQTFTIAGNITNTAALPSVGFTNYGSGTLIFTGTNTFSGTYTVTSNAAVTTIAGSGTLASGLKIVNAGIFNYGSSAAQTLSGVISGSGPVCEYGPGALTLSAVNTYTGATTIGSSGSLVISGSGTLGSGTYSPNITNDGAFTYNSSATQTLSGVISGSGSVTAQAGTLKLNGANLYTGGTSLKTGALLDIGNAAALGGGTLSISGNGSFDNTSGGALTIANAINMNAGSPTFVGSANLTISGTATISGSTTRTVTVTANTLTLSSAVGDAGGGVNFIKAGAGTLKLSGVNTYTGKTTISAGILALGSSGSLANSPVISIAAGATFDVSAITSYLLSTTNGITSSGTATAATLKGATTVNLGSQPIILTYDGSHPALTISQGTLQLNGNAFTVTNTAAALGVGSYTIVTQTTGNITSSGTYPVTVLGNALAGSNTATIAVVGGTVTLVVKAPPVFSALTATPSITYGATSIALTGKISSGSLFPANGEAVTVTINGHLVGGTVTNSTGDFLVNYNDASLATDAAGSYTITHSYAGNGSLNSATTATTSLTVNPATLSVTAANQTKAYGQTVTFSSGSTSFTSSGLKNGETIGSVTLAVSGSGGASNAPASGSPYTITPSAATGGTFSAANYSITYNTGTLTVNAASLTVTAAHQSKTYGQTVTFGSGSTNFTSSGLVNGDVIDSVTLAVSGGGGASNAPVSGSPYTITPSAATGASFTAANYSITYNTGTLSINPVVLGVTADNFSRAYGATNAVFTVEYTNFVNGQSIGTSDVVGSPALTSAATGADVGAYAITNAIGTLASTNYTFTLTNGILTVTNALSTNALTASTNIALPGAAVVFTSTLSTLVPSLAVPTNLVSFLVDGAVSASVYPSSGVAAITNSSLAHGYHTVEADYAGDTNALGGTNIVGSTNTLSVLINTPPVAGAASYGRPHDTALHIGITGLLTNASDADSDVVTLLAVDAASTNGATIVTNGSFITYTQPATNGNVTDTFTYTVQDSFGATATGTVTITILPVNNGPAVNITGMNTLSNGTVQINFAGVPNYSYLVETTTNLTTPITWTILSTNTAGTNGLFQYTDLDATNYPTRYYRTARP